MEKKFPLGQGAIQVGSCKTILNLFSFNSLGGGPAPKTRLVVRHRPMNSIEDGEMKRRLTLLEPLAEEEEEEEVSQGEGGEGQNGEQVRQ